MAYPLITVITASFNAVEFIEQTIESVLVQTYPHLEYIVIDGGSTDGTADIIRRYESRLAYWHSQPDRGQAHGLNQGLARGHGDWILFLNADDFFLGPTVLEEMAPHLIAHHEADLVFGQAIIMSREKVAHPLPSRPFLAPWRYRENRIYGSPWRWRHFCWDSTIPHQAAFTNRRYFERVGNFDESFRIGMDYELFLRGGKGLRAVYVEVPVSGMRAGGVSGDIYAPLRDSRRAQLKNRALAAPLAWTAFFLQLGRFLLVRAVHRTLMPRLIRGTR
jgi:glycosyltransferase involved in cell wall biosynthesis